MEFKVKVLAAVQHNENIKHFVIQKPDDYGFTPGQAMEISLDFYGISDVKRAFSITCTSDTPNLEFMAKINPQTDGFSRALAQVQAGDYLRISPPLGSIHYKGPGYFIAGGTGITPFISIFKQLKELDSIEGNFLIYTARRDSDVILERELRWMFGNSCSLNYTDNNRRIDFGFLKDKVTSTRKYFYICGPELMVENVKNILLSMGVCESLMVQEKTNDLEAYAA